MPKDRDAHMTRAIVLFDMGDYPGVLADTSSMLDIDDHDAGALYLRGAAKLKMGDTAGGQQNLLEAKTFNPNVASDFSSYDIAP
jgi:Flp pilus assembly protein TadD